VTKSVQIEAVKSLNTEAFVAALRRFVARREKPKTVYSDNGTNFQGASTQLHEVYNMLQSSSQMARVQDFLATEGCDLRFIPPHGPHFGGL
jgi:transposase InsO family protein